MFKQVALAAILIIVFWVTITGQSQKTFPVDSNEDTKREESIGGAEAIKAIARLGDLSRIAIRERLRQMRLPFHLPDPTLVNKFVEAQKMVVASGKRVDKLKAALQPVLDYHGRSQMPIYVVWSDQPKACLVDRAVIIITNRLMISATDEEIRGIVAHELAHEYVWDERIRAREAKDGKLMRELELFCDVVAAFTLKEIGDDPSSYSHILMRMTMIGSKMGSVTRSKSDTHPSLNARKKLNKFLCQRLD